jgi:AcrR family transcriptional regulator
MAVTTASAAIRRDSILEAALECFNARGVSGTTIEDVRERAGASVGSIYHHFGSKEQLAAALHVEGARSYQAGFLEVLQKQRSARAGIHAIVRHHLRWVADNPDLARFMLGGRDTAVAASAIPELRELNRAFFAAIAAWVQPHARRGALRPFAVDLYDALVLGPAQEFARHWLAGRTTTSLRAAEPALVAAAWNAVRSPKEDQ